MFQEFWTRYKREMKVLMKIFCCKFCFFFLCFFIFLIEVQSVHCRIWTQLTFIISTQNLFLWWCFYCEILQFWITSSIEHFILSAQNYVRFLLGVTVSHYHSFQLSGDKTCYITCLLMAWKKNTWTFRKHIVLRHFVCPKCFMKP